MIRFLSHTVLTAGFVMAGTALPARAQQWFDQGSPRYGAARPMAGSYVYGQAPGAMPIRAYPYEASSPYTNSAFPDPRQQAQQQQRDCNRGRLIGGIVGGGLGYVASRDDGRSWAVPLGALLGSQVGCSTGSGRGPLPW